MRRTARFSVRLARFLMKLRETSVRFDIDHPETGAFFQEAFAHPDFVRATPERRKEIGLIWAEELYKFEKENPIHQAFQPVDLKAICTGGRLLDLGCYIGGRSVRWLEAYEAREIHGLDVDQKFIDVATEFATRKNANAHFVVGFGENLPFPDAHFDAILTQDTLEHVHDLSAVMRECRRVLRPGGHLVLTFPGLYNPASHHWFFGFPTILDAYFSVLDERGEEAAWYRRQNRDPLPHERGYTLNGATARSFRNLIAGQWDVVFDGFKDRASRNRNPLKKALISTAKKLDLRALRELSEVVYVLRRP
jgi:SAM-dependent methyltransferase